MKKQKKCIVFSHRRCYVKHTWCVFCAFPLLTVSNALRAEEVSELQTNIRTASDRRTLPANAAVSSSKTSVPASANGSAKASTDASRSSEVNSSKTGGTQAVASDTTSSVGISASNTASPFQASVFSAQTAPTNTSNGVFSSTGSSTGSSATGISSTTISNTTTTPATASAAITLNATDATVPTSPITGVTTSVAGAAPTPPNTANFSQTPPAPANIPLGTTAGSGTNETASEEEEPQDLGDILDLRPPAKLKVSLLPWVIALLIVLSAGGLWFLLKRKRHGKAKKEKPTKPIDPYEAVLQALKEASKKLDVANPKPFAFFLTDAVRLYLSRIFRLPAPESTTQELLQQLPWCTELTDDLKTNITQFLQRCDLVKFTTMPFDEPFLLQLYQQAEAIVAASHELTKPKPTPVAPNVAPDAVSSSKPQKTPKK